MHKQNTLQFNVADMNVGMWQLCTKATSYSFGRRLYRLQQDQHAYWLKTQVKATNLVVEQNYLREVKFYQMMQGQLDCLLPIQHINLSTHPEFSDHYPSFILPHATPWLTDPDDLSLMGIKEKIFEIAVALEALFDMGYLHADLKQEHFVCWRGQLKLLDLEQVLYRGQQHSHLSATPRYMAPELFQGQPKSLATELYALGIILYEWLSGQRLSAKSYMDWAYLHCQHLEIQLPERYQLFLSLIKALTFKHQDNRLTDISALKQQILLINC